MYKLIIGALLLLALESHAISIKDHEELSLSARCTIVTDERMECEEFCSIYNRVSGNNLSHEVFWNCDDQGNMTAFESRYNNEVNNKSLKSGAGTISDCKQKPGELHIGDCLVDSQELIKTLSCPSNMAVTFLSTEHPRCQEWAGFDGCPSWDVSLIMRGNEFWFTYTTKDRWGNTGTESTPSRNWVTSPTGADVSGEYSVTPNPTFGRSGDVRFDAGSSTRTDYMTGYNVCEIADPGNCASLTCPYTVFIEP